MYVEHRCYPSSRDRLSDVELWQACSLPRHVVLLEYGFCSRRLVFCLDSCILFFSEIRPLFPSGLPVSFSQCTIRCSLDELVSLPIAVVVPRGGV